jgi:hypothetical protein
LKVGFSEKCENARNRRIAVFSATRSPIDARFVASDGKSKPALDRRNGFFDFDPRNLWGAKWGVLHFFTKCATEFFRSQTSCGKVVGLVDPKPTQKTGPKNSTDDRDIAIFRNFRVSEIHRSEMARFRSRDAPSSVERSGSRIAVTLVRFGTVAVGIAPRRSTESGSPSDAGFPSYGSPKTTRRRGGGRFRWAARARMERVWKANSFLSRSGGALAVASKVFRCGTSDESSCGWPRDTEDEEYRIAECWVGGPRGHPTRGLGIRNRQSFETVDRLIL